MMIFVIAVSIYAVSAAILVPGSCRAITFANSRALCRQMKRTRRNLIERWFRYFQCTEITEKIMNGLISNFPTTVW